jgi:Methyltransferase domain.
VRAVRADGRSLPFADGEFELGFSNAVVEHVAGGRNGQRQFVLELCRVAQRVFVTTPNRWFPIDPHTLLPLAHWLPPGAGRQRLFRARGFDDVLDPLGPKDLASLFPYPVRVLNRGVTLVAVGPA